MESTRIENNGSSASYKHINSDIHNNKPQAMDPVMSLSSFTDFVTSLITGPKKTNNKNVPDQDKKQDNNSTNSHHQHHHNPNQERSQNEQLITQPQQAPPQPLPKRACRAPLSKRFGHPCTCSQSSIHHKSHHSNNNSTGSLPPAAYTIPLHLYDPVSKKCLPTSRNRDMLLKECRSNVASPYPLPHKLYHEQPCVYDDLVCDSRRSRCVCRQSLHLYYESNQTTFGCVPIGPSNSPDGRINCRSGYIYNVISKECQKIFDVNELPPSYTTGVSATQFSFVTIVLIWILLLILIVTAKLRKLRTSNLHRNSPMSERRLNHGSSYRHQNPNASTWLHPFIARVNGHHHLNHHRTTMDRHTQAIDDPANYNDTDFFLTNGNRQLSEIFPGNNFTGSQQSLNNPPPKFEEIYPTCQEEQIIIQPPSNEDLPSYDEAMKLQNTMPPDINLKE